MRPVQRARVSTGRRAAVAASPGVAAPHLDRDRRAARAARQMLAATSSATVWLPSITRARRNQVVNGSARTAAARTSARSSTTSPNPPACSTRFIALSARVASPRLANPQQVATDRAPSAAADSGSNDRRYRRAPPARHARRPRASARTDDRRPARRAPADDLREMAAPQAAAERRVDRRHAGAAIVGATIARRVDGRQRSGARSSA